jgi:hypothetical protein
VEVPSCARSVSKATLNPWHFVRRGGACGPKHHFVAEHCQGSRVLMSERFGGVDAQEYRRKEETV